MDALNQLVSLSWLVFWILWIGAAIYSKQLNHDRIGPRWPRLVFFMAIVILLLNSFAKAVNLNYKIDHHHQALRVLGLLLFYAGLAVAIWARRHLGNSWGVPMSTKKDTKLVTSGPYSLVRNPIYSGFLLAIVGSALVNNLSWLIFFLLAAAFVAYSSLEEEKNLARQFPKTYPAYKRRTKMLIPYVF